METTVPFYHPERRTGVRMASVVDAALDLAEKFGWRYAIAYLIGERVPSQIIQRLLSGDGKVRSHSPVLHDSPSWWGSNVDGLHSLFESLRQREATTAYCNADMARAPRADAYYELD
ncbi:hypothetical protein ACN9MU_21430 [Pseudoduganella sp. R-32]|uniref:hypothetical protein n=1 Tax=unclassified Pseudoduganella TaxID=2637179 RepID=UPI003CEA11CF